MTGCAHDFCCLHVLIFFPAAHRSYGDCVTMPWDFDPAHVSGSHACVELLSHAACLLPFSEMQQLLLKRRCGAGGELGGVWHGAPAGGPYALPLLLLAWPDWMLSADCNTPVCPSEQ